MELLHHVAEDLVRRLVEVRHTNSRGQPRKVRVLRRHVGRRLGGELIQLVRRDAVVDALDDLLGQDLCGARPSRNCLGTFTRRTDALTAASMASR